MHVIRISSMYIRMYVCMHAYTDLPPRAMYVCKCIYTYMHVCMYIYTYIPARATLGLCAAGASGASFGLKFRQHQIHLCLPQDLLAV